jgi:transketolase
MKPRFDPKHLRRTILEMAYSGSTVHIACAFSIVEILAVLYRSHLRLGPDPRSPDRDYLVLSKGHGVMAQYACLRELGWVTDAEVRNYFGDGTALKGLSDAHVPGLEVTSGSLGHGLSVGVGLALAAKRNGTGQRVYAVVGDGESNEGPIWEALLFAAQQRLGNLTVIIDANGQQAMGRTREVLDLEPLTDKLRAFGCETREVDGHDEAALDSAFSELTTWAGDMPRAVVARTVKGHGVSFMADDNRWHYTRLTAETYQHAQVELSA